MLSINLWRECCENEEMKERVCHFFCYVWREMGERESVSVETRTLDHEQFVDGCALSFFLMRVSVLT